MRILILFICVSATLALSPVVTTPAPGCGGDKNAEVRPCGDPCPITCDNKDDTGPKMCPAICLVNGCACKKGYVKNKVGKCIKPENCPPTCPGPNEVYSTSKNPCESCSDLSGPACSLSNPCPAGCNCKDGYARDADGVCIEELQCPCSDLNAERVSCPNPCPRTCANLLTLGTVPCTRMCLRQGCTCKDGFVFSSTGECVKPEQCPPLACPANEEYNSCPAYCTFDDDCGSYVEGFIRDCARPPEEGIPCIPRCQCKHGFVRIDGECVAPIKCCVEPNTQLVDCPAPCEDTCSFKSEASCIQNCPARKCICSQGYVRNGTMCILESDCCPPTCPGPNEVYSTCKNPCESCSDLSGPACSLPDPCPAGCNCKDGYARNADGKCIEELECPCPDPNAIRVLCPNPCAPSCQFLDTFGTGPRICAAMCLRQGCTCKDGFIFNSDRVCVKPLECPCSDPNAERITCPNPCPRTCANLLTFGTKPCASMCLNQGCTCKKGYVFNSVGVCVKPEKCPPPTCPGKNEEFSLYASANPATCENSNPSCSGKTTPGCVCKKGFLRSNGKCICKADCPKKCNKPNEEYQECGSPCEATCENRNPKCKTKCIPGCFCKKGYVRDGVKCIAVKNCKTCPADKTK